MKTVIYTDRDGYIRRAALPDDAGDEQAALGVPAGPPDLEQLDWLGIKRDIHNALAGNGLFTWLDVQQSPVGFQAAWSVLKRHLVALYRQDETIHTE